MVNFRLRFQVEQIKPGQLDPNSLENFVRRIIPFRAPKTSKYNSSIKGVLPTLFTWELTMYNIVCVM